VIGSAGSGVSAIPVLVAHLILSSDHDHISIVSRTFWCKSAARGVVLPEHYSYKVKARRFFVLCNQVEDSVLFQELS